jgi:glutamate racemase
MMMPEYPGQAPVLLLDSGIGGLSICESIRAAELRCPLVYVADNAWFPYGLREETELQSRVVRLMQSLVGQFAPRLVVLACNTLSTLALPALRAQFQVPFVGVVPAIKPAAELSRSRSIALLATQATVRRAYTDQLIRQFAPDCRVLRVGASDLVLEAERVMHGAPVRMDYLRTILQPIIQARENDSLDTVVLGCTHFPLLRDALEEAVPGLTWIDSGAAIARRIRNLAPDLGAAVLDPDLRLMFTAADPEQAGLARELERRGFGTPRFGQLTLQCLSM